MGRICFERVGSTGWKDLTVVLSELILAVLTVHPSFILEDFHVLREAHHEQLLADKYHVYLFPFLISERFMSHFNSSYIPAFYCSQCSLAR